MPHVREANVGRNDRRRRRRSKDFQVEAPGFSPGNKIRLEEPHLAAGRLERSPKDEATHVKPPKPQSNPQTKENKLLKRARPWQRIIAKTAILKREQKSPLKSGLFLLPEEGPPAKSLKILERH